jgi:phospholipid/cholesterol/gamma-HCH transport system substrate-binding protein
MRRIVATLGLLGVIALAFFGLGSGGNSGGSYQVRAIFDNGGFVVADEDVRIAGANVGSVESVGVTMPDEPATSDGKPDPGKAIVVMSIEDPAFQDFRSDASCIIRPGSLLGEKYIDCEPTQPRAPGTSPPRRRWRSSRTASLARASTSCRSRTTASRSTSTSSTTSCASRSWIASA